VCVNDAPCDPEACFATDISVPFPQPEYQQQYAPKYLDTSSGSGVSLKVCSQTNGFDAEKETTHASLG
jgi:hypothetical protein